MGIKLKDKASIGEVLKEMTLEEKAYLVTGNTAFTTYGLERLGIPSATVLDGGTGVNFYQYYGDICERIYERDGDCGTSISKKVSASKMMEILDHLQEPEKLDEDHYKIYRMIQDEMDQIMPARQMPGCFPPGILLGASWDEETVRLCGNAAAKEADAYKVDMLLGTPNVNIHRDPRNGRIFEGYSEDPCLVSKLAPQFVKGVQEEGLTANVKHFAANNQETHRQNINEQIPKRALYEIYFPGFKACVDAGVKSVMSAYNKINGKACAMNKWLLTDVLRDEWGYQGMVVSDWGAVYDQAEALAAGNDLDMPGKRDITPILEAVKSGALDESDLDQAAGRILNMLLEMPVMKESRKNEKIDRDYSRKAAYRAAVEGIVLLKNDGVLPIDPGSIVSFVGDKCLKFVESGGGSAVVYTDQSTSLYEEAKVLADGKAQGGADGLTGKAEAQRGADVLADGKAQRGENVLADGKAQGGADALTEEAALAGKDTVCYGNIMEDGDITVLAVSAPGQEGTDRPEMDLEPEEKELLLAALREAKEKGQKTVVLLNVAGPVDVSDYIGMTDALLCVFFPGMEGGRAAARILYGKENPSGKLPVTFPKRYKDCPTYGNFPGCAGEVCYGEGIFVGYRYYEYKDIEPMYPFGFGLSYTSFSIKNAVISGNVMDMDQNEILKVQVDVENTGDRAGKEVVQLYIQDVVSTLVKPVKELKDFRKIELQPSEKKTVCFEITKQMLASYDPEYEKWESEAGEYRVLIGSSSDNITAVCSFTAKGKTIYNYNQNTLLDTIVKDERADRILRDYLKEQGADISILEEYIIFFPHVPLVKMLTVLLGDKYPGEAERERKFEIVYSRLGELDL